MTKLSPEALKQGLAQFSGTETWYPVYPNLMITDGVKWLCDHAACYWLLDCIFSYQLLPNVVQEPFQVIDLKVNLEEQTATISVTDGNEHELFLQELGYTDFPLSTLRLYYTDGVVLLPREY